MSHNPPPNVHVKVEHQFTLESLGEHSAAHCCDLLYLIILILYIRWQRQQQCHLRVTE